MLYNTVVAREILNDCMEISLSNGKSFNVCESTYPRRFLETLFGVRNIPDGFMGVVARGHKVLVKNDFFSKANVTLDGEVQIRGNISKIYPNCLAIVLGRNSSITINGTEPRLMISRVPGVNCQE